MILLKSVFVTVFALSFTSAAQAATVADLFARISPNKSECFARTYSAQHLKSHPKQTVRDIKVKLFVLPDFPDSKGMLVNLTRQNRRGIWGNSLYCFDHEGKVLCNIECDGGSTTIDMENGRLMIKNNGFVIRGGCGSADQEITEYLKARPGGDDIFALEPQPEAACANMKKF